MCFFCKNDTMIQSLTTHVVTFDDCIIIVKNVPCLECDQCGEKFYDDKIMEQLEAVVDKAKSLSSEVFVTDFSHKVA